MHKICSKWSREMLEALGVRNRMVMRQLRVSGGSEVIFYACYVGLVWYAEWALH